jgi:hypothetical protein
MLPFTREQFVDVFAAYNGAVWPAQIVAYLVGSAMLLALARPSANSDRIIGAGLAIMWAWTGIAYHWLFFSSINAAAFLFGALFLLQAVLFARAATIGRRALAFRFSGGLAAWLGVLLVIYAALLYPLLSVWVGHRYPHQPSFGITPCPVTLFTLGLLLLTRAPVAKWLLAIPLAWALVGGSAAFLLEVPQDWPLLFSSLVVLVLVLRDRRRGALRPSGLSIRPR